MEIKLINEIKEAEQKGEDIINSARDKADKEIKTLELEFRSKLENLEKNFQDKKKQLKIKAGDDSEIIFKRQNISTEDVIKKLRAEAYTKEVEITGFIISKMMG